MSEPTKEYGWRFLQDGEVIREGDEFWWRGLGPWKNDPMLSIGAEFSSYYCQYRRRIDPGEGYEIVPENEASGLLSGNGKCSDGRYEWNGTHDGVSWFTVLNGNCCRQSKAQAFRRRKTVQPQWPAPTFGRSSGPCLYWDRGSGLWLGSRCGGHDVYWLPTPPDPTPKPPEKSDAEKAWDKCCYSNIVGGNEKHAWIAGFNAAKKG